MTQQLNVILIAHSVHADITEDEMRAVVSPTWIVRGVVDVRPVRLTLQETLGTDWVTHARTQAVQWAAQVRPLLEKYPGAHLVYFGLAPIPLAFHLGTLTERWSGVQVFLRHHTTRAWTYAGGEAPSISSTGAPTESIRSTDPVIVSISTTLPADADRARTIVGPTSGEIDIRTDPLGEDVLASQEAVKAVAEQFKDTLDRIEKHRANVSEIHLIAAVPVGVAFLLGTFVTATRHAQFVTYQYHRSNTPHLVEALRVPLRGAAVVALSRDDIAAAAELRSSWEQARQHVASFFREHRSHWYEILGTVGAAFQSGGFEALTQVELTPLLASIDLEVREVEDGFRYDEVAQRWALSDELLTSIRRLVPVAALDRAGRMLLLHEALHHGQQGLSAATAPLIRLAPKVLEELDYLADIWAVVHEFVLGGFVDKTWAVQRLGLLSILETAVQTMWAFDADRVRGALEVRRVNRYLIWYVNLARIEHAASVFEAVRILANKPVIDLIGPPVQVQDGRLVALLDRASVHSPELCIIDRHGRLRRLGSTNAASVATVTLALGTHDHEKLRKEIRAFVEAER